MFESVQCANPAQGLRMWTEVIPEADAATHPIASQGPVWPLFGCNAAVLLANVVLGMKAEAELAMLTRMLARKMALF